MGGVLLLLRLLEKVVQGGNDAVGRRGGNIVYEQKGWQKW